MGKISDFFNKLYDGFFDFDLPGPGVPLPSAGNGPCCVPPSPEWAKECGVEVPVEDKEFYELTDPRGCRIEIYRDRKKEWRWRLLSANNKVVATSGEGYKRKGSMRKSLDLVREVIPFVPVEEK